MIGFPIKNTMQSPYSTVPSVCAYLGIEVPSESSDEYAEIEQYILAMSTHIDRMANRTIWREEEETFLYDGDGTDYLLIKDCIDPVVEVDGVARTVYGYPQSKAYASRIKLEPGYRFTKGIQNVSVTGLQCMALYLPDDIEFACRVLVAGIYNTAHPDEDAKTLVSERIGNWQGTYKTDNEKSDYDRAKAIISSYRRIAL